MLLADSTALGLDATWWTAIAAIVALLLGLAGIFTPPISAWIRRPKLELCFSELVTHSERIGDVYYLRLPVKNAPGKSTAENVEVFLEAIHEEHVDNPINLPTYLPIRLVWTHDRDAVCGRIAGGASRLLDFGALTFTINSTTGFVEVVMARIEEANPILFAFHFEIQPTANRLGLPVGTYTLHFLTTSALSMHRQKVTITIRNRHLSDGTSLTDFIHINQG